MARVVVCVPCWNNLTYTQWMVESVRKHSDGHDVQLALFDNGSTDGTRKYLHSLGADVTWLDTNIGVNPAWNRLLRNALDLRHEPDVICLANNDLIVGPGWLDAPCKALAAEGHERYFLPNGGPWQRATFEDDARTVMQRFARQRVPGRAGWCLFFTPEAVRHFLPIPPELVLWYGDDWIHYKLGQAGYRCEVLLDCCVLHFGSKSVEVFPNKVATIARDRAAFRRLTGLDVP